MDSRAVWACDPGNHTGIAMGMFDINQHSVAEVMKNRSCGESLTIELPISQQIREISMNFRKFYRAMVEFHGIEPHHVYCVMEDFILSPESPGGRDVVSPVAIAYGVM